MRTAAPAHSKLLSTQKKPIGSSQLQILPPRGLSSDNDQSRDVICTGVELSHPALGTPQTLDLQTCYICQGTSNQESIMICDGQGCSVIAHLNCYFSAGSQDANDAITDIEHWHCENCGGLPRHMHPRPRAAKRARVSFDPDLDVVTESPITEGAPATGHQGGGWGGHWQTRTEMPQLTTGKGKEAMEDLVDPPLTPDVLQPDSIIDPPRRIRTPRKKKHRVRDGQALSHQQLRDASRKGTKPNAGTKP